MISAPEVMLVLTQLPFSSLAKTENYHKTDEQKNDKRKRVADSLMTALNSTTGILYPFFGIIEGSCCCKKIFSIRGTDNRSDAMS